MKIKTRILLYNTLMVLLSLIALLAIGSFVIGLWGLSGTDRSTNRLIADAADILDDLTGGDEIGAAASELEELGYTLYVFSSEGEAGSVLPSALGGIGADHAESFSISGTMMLVRLSPPYLFIAMSDGPIPKTEKGVKSLLVTFLTVGGISIAVIISISYIFTSNILKHISKPLAALTSGAVRVELGDLSHPIDYHESDEFRPVCASFDRMQEHLKAERDKNAAYEKARTDLVTGISHDLRTPLTSVKGYIKGIQDGIANTPEKVQRYLSTAYAKADEMEVLLQRLFFFSKLETGNLPLNRRVADLHDFIRYYTDEASVDPHMQNVIFETSLPGIPCFSDVDVHQLRRVFNNMTENAIRYSGAPHLCIHISLIPGKAVHTIVFADNGSGIPPDMLPHIFEQFWRGDSSRSMSGNSSGLGLYIVKYIIDSHGGDIEAVNDNGLKLMIRLPCAKEAQS